MHFTCFIGITAVALFLPFWVFCICALIYVSVYRGYELIVLGVAVDAQFGSVSSTLWGMLYSITTLCVVFGALFLKPYLSVYDRYAS